jgi:SAM-dependent methyltransferase
MEFTGERYLPELDWPEISYEHWHRYLLAEALAEGRVVLDVACGEGYGASRLARKASRVVGVDISPEAVAHARSTYAADSANLEFLEGSADRLPFQGEAIFDLVTSFETIEHIPEDAQVRFLDEIKRVIKPSGVCVISSPNKSEYSDKPGYKNEFHSKEFYIDEFVDFLGARFRHVATFGQRVYPVSYLWPLDPAGSAATLERQIAFKNGSFDPCDDDCKSALYVIAVASDEPIDPALGGSILIDVSSRAVAARLEELMTIRDLLSKANRLVGETHDEIARLNREWEACRRERDELKNELETTIKSFERRIVGARFDAVSMRHESTEMMRHNLDLLATKESLQNSNESLRHSNAALQHELDQIRASRSWKLVHQMKSLMRKA